VENRVRVVVTGVAGFIGSAIARHVLRSSEDTIVGVDRLSDYYPLPIKRANLETLDSPRFQFIEGSLSSGLELRELVSDADVVYHQAGQPGVRPSWGASFEPYVRDNVLATQRLLEACHVTGGSQRIVYASSSSVYGDASRYPCRESDNPAPISPYGVTKLAGEHLSVLYGRVHGLNTVALRYFTVFGPGQRPDMAFTRLCVCALTGTKMPIFGDGKQVRDFTFIDDVVAANLAAAGATTSGGEVLNISGGTSASLNDAIQIIESLSGGPIEIDRRAPAPGDVARTGGDSDKATAVLGWRPRVGLADGLAAQWAWARENVAALAEAIVPATAR